ncbi:MAG: spore germination protein [Halanaerobiaceae bacterium]
MKKPITGKLQENIDIIKNELGGEDSFDILSREFSIGGKKACLIFLDGFIKDDLIIPLKSLMETDRKEISVDTVTKILNSKLPYYELETVDNIEETLDEILSGAQALLIENCKEVIILDARTWLSRTPDEPELEKATRGPGDGFVETMLFNVNAVRRRIRDTKFRAQVMQVGKRAKNDVALVYMDDIVDKGLLEEVKIKLENTEVDGLPLADKSIEDIITGGSINPLPKVRYTERPDNVAAHILEGHLAIIVDNSPTALILPAPFFSHIQTLEVFRKNTIVGTYLSFMRLLAMAISIFLPVLWFLMATNKELLPEYLQFIGIKQESTIGLGVQFILASIGIDFIRMASVQVPGSLATSLSLIGALILGDFAVQVGLFSPEVILYMAVAGLANFAIPGYEMALTLKLLRFIYLIAAIVGNIIGFIVLLILTSLWIVFSKSFGVYYLWPLIPFDYQALKSVLINQTILDLSQGRPQAIAKKNEDRMNKEE